MARPLFYALIPFMLYVCSFFFYSLVPSIFSIIVLSLSLIVDNMHLFHRYTCVFASSAVSGSGSMSSAATRASSSSVTCALPPSLPGLASAASLPSAGAVVYDVTVTVNGAPIALA